MLRNAAALMVSQAVMVALGLVITVLVSRYLGPTAVGKLSVATSLWAIGAMLIAAGTDTLLLKETARSSTRVYGLLLTAITVRFGIGALVFLAILAFAYVNDYPPDTVAVIVLLGCAAVVTQVGDLSRAVLQGLEHVRAVAIGNILSRVFRTGAVITLLWLGRDLVQIAAVSIGTALIESLVPLWDVWRRGSVSLTVRLDDAMWMLRRGLPFFASALFLVCYGQVDVLILSLLASEAELGWYSAAIQFLSTLSIVPAVVCTVVLPAFMRTSVQTPDLLPARLERAFGVVMVMAIAVGCGVSAMSGPIVRTIYGPSFAPSAPVLALVGVVIALAYQNTLVACCLNAIDRQARVTWLLGGAVLATIPLDLIAIPWSHREFGNAAVGAALTSIITEGGVLIMLVRALPAGTIGRTTWSRGARALVAGGVMVAVIWPVRHLFVVIPIALGASVYAALTKGLRLLTPEDWRLIADVWRTLAAPWRRLQDPHITVVGSS